MTNIRINALLKYAAMGVPLDRMMAVAAVAVSVDMLLGWMQVRPTFFEIYMLTVH